MRTALSGLVTPSKHFLEIFFIKLKFCTLATKGWKWQPAIFRQSTEFKWYWNRPLYPVCLTFQCIVLSAVKFCIPLCNGWHLSWTSRLIVLWNICVRDTCMGKIPQAQLGSVSNKVTSEFMLNKATFFKPLYCFKLVPWYYHQDSEDAVENWNAYTHHCC